MLKEGLLHNRLRRLSKNLGQQRPDIEEALSNLEAVEMLFEDLPADVKQKHWPAFEARMNDLGGLMSASNFAYAVPYPAQSESREN